MTPTRSETTYAAVGNTMAGSNTAKHKFTVTPLLGPIGKSVDLSCSCGWKSHEYREYAKIAVAQQAHIIEVLAARAGIAVEW